MNVSLLSADVNCKLTDTPEAYIRLVPKTPAPKLPADSRPISITPVPVLTRMTERIVVQRYVYPTDADGASTLTAVQQPVRSFRPTGSTTAAIIHLLNTVINLLSTEQYVIVISLQRLLKSF